MSNLRISFSCKFKPSSGKQKFAIRLAKAMRKVGAKITDKRPDANLVFVKGIKKGCVNIMRLDNAWINEKMNSVGKNSRINKTLRKCRGAIYQGVYSKKVCDKFIGRFKRKCAIISNGCDPLEFNEVFEHSKPYVLAFSRWRPHKRLKDITVGFLESGLKKTHDLIICGEPDFTVKDSSVIYMGKTGPNKINAFIKGCDFVSHLAYMDCCPNSVVESLVCGKNILYSDSGGMKELVGEHGYLIHDRPFKFKLIDLYNAPELDFNEVVDGYNGVLGMEVPIRSDLYIDTIALKYIEFIEKVVSNA